MDKHFLSSSISEALKSNSLFWKDHMVQRMRERNIRIDDILTALKNFSIIEEYNDDRPFPSFLIIGYAGDKPIHIVLAVNAYDKEVHLITAYIPDDSVWNDNYRRRI